MTNKLYEPDQAKEIKRRIESIALVKKNKKAISRRCADEIKEDIDLQKLLDHDDKLYFEEVYNSIK
jgi:hypothetical protein